MPPKLREKCGPVLPPGGDPRFQPLEQGAFCFACHPGVPCFNQCCRKLNLMLTPYDLLRLRSHLGLSSEEFLDRFAIVEPGQNGWPLARLRMNDEPQQRCPFVSPEGCTVYPHRPGACRIYPLGRATRGQQGPRQESYFLVREEHCQGFSQEKSWSPQSWIKDQGLEAYNELNDRFMPLITRQPPAAEPRQFQQRMQIFFMACYNLEAFRRFVLGSSLPQRLQIPAQRLELLKNNDLQLLKFAFEWLHWALFGEQVSTWRPGLS